MYKCRRCHLTLHILHWTTTLLPTPILSRYAKISLKYILYLFTPWSLLQLQSHHSNNWNTIKIVHINRINVMDVRHFDFIFGIRMKLSLFSFNVQIIFISIKGNLDIFSFVFGLFSFIMRRCGFLGFPFNLILFNVMNSCLLRVHSSWSLIIVD